MDFMIAQWRFCLRVSDRGVLDGGVMVELGIGNFLFGFI
jgi:hypothetical protein